MLQLVGAPSTTWQLWWCTLTLAKWMEGNCDVRTATKREPRMRAFQVIRTGTHVAITVNVQLSAEDRSGEPETVRYLLGICIVRCKRHGIGVACL